MDEIHGDVHGEMRKRALEFMCEHALPWIDPEMFIVTCEAELIAGAESVPLASAWSKDGVEHAFMLRERFNTESH